MENEANKQSSKLTLIAGILTIANIVTIIYIISDFFRGGFGADTAAAIICLIIFTISSVVVGIEARKKERNGAVYPLLVTDCFIVGVLSIATIVGLLISFGGRNNSNDARDRIEQEATVAYVKEHISGKTIRLYSEQEEDKHFYRDYNKEVVNAFMALDFTKGSSSDVKYKDREIPFYSEQDHSAYFNKDYTVLTVHAETNAIIYGRNSFDNRYLLSESDASSFKSLIENVISKQRAVILAAQEEAKQNLSLNNFSASFANSSGINLFVKNAGEKKDENKFVLSCLQEIFASGIDQRNASNNYLEEDFRYEINEPSLSILVNEKYNWLRLRVKYEPYSDAYYVNEDYTLTVEQTNQLMTVARDQFSA